MLLKIMQINIQPDISTLVLIYIVLTIAFYGWGKLTVWVLKVILPRSVETFFITIWIGWSTLLWILQIIHLKLPINWEVSMVLYPIGFIVGLLKVASTVYRWAQASIKPQFGEIIKISLFLIFMTLAAIWAASRGISGVSNYDSGLYHFNTIRWINSYPIVPGLGNLHDRFAYNQSYFLYAASLNFFPYFPFGHTVANSFLFLLSIATVLSALFITESSSSKANVYRISNLFGFLLVFHLGITSDGMSSPSPDLPSSIIQILLFIWFINVIQQVQAGSKPFEKLFNILVLATTLVTVKLSNLVFAASLAGICVAFTLRSIKDHLKFIKVNKWSILIPTAIFLIWMVRGVFLSGYPLYPSTFGRVNTDWAMPAEIVKQNANRDYAWARMQGRPPEEVLANMDWVRPWLSRTYKKYKPDVIYPSLLAIGIGILTCLYMVQQKRFRVLLANTIILVPAVSSLLFWFFTAPEPRLAHALFLLLPLSAIMLFIVCLKDVSQPRAVNWVTVLTFLTTLGFLLAPQFPYIISSFTQQYVDIISVPIIEKTTDSGLKVYTPETGDQCWNSPLPCTPYFDPKLRLRTPGILETGFTGKWAH